ncbi:MAG TPA: hypothetical protein VN461_19030 [Vicinamibacteria bacterium]|nr:hypothetical protein [Vicinamibacteria bacterium]
MSSRPLEVAAVIFLITGTVSCLPRAAPSRTPLASETAARPPAESAPTPAPAGTPSATAPSPVALAARSSGDDSFRSRVQPILERCCMPCHFPGGQMYERLPFDRAAVVRSKSEPLLRRLKVAEEHRVVEEWLRTPSPAP